MLWVRKFDTHESMWTFIDDLDLSVSWYPRLLEEADVWELTWYTPYRFGDWDGWLPTPGDEIDSLHVCNL